MLNDNGGSADDAPVPLFLVTLRDEKADIASVKTAIGLRKSAKLLVRCLRGQRMRKPDTAHRQRHADGTVDQHVTPADGDAPAKQAAERVRLSPA